MVGRAGRKMKVFVLIVSDRDMRPLSDVATTAVFATRPAMAGNLLQSCV